MELSIETIVFYVLLIDSIGANFVAWFGVGNKWYKENFKVFFHLFPATKGWTTTYLVLVLWIGLILYRAGAF